MCLFCTQYVLCYMIFVSCYRKYSLSVMGNMFVLYFVMENVFVLYMYFVLSCALKQTEIWNDTYPACLLMFCLFVLYIVYTS